jgi:hypothetical protein
MAEVIPFPKPTLKQLELVRIDTSVDARVHAAKIAMRMLVHQITAESIEPHKLFIVISDERLFENRNSLYYLNLGFARDELVKTIDEILSDSKQNPDDWDY